MRINSHEIKVHELPKLNRMRKLTSLGIKFPEENSS